MRAPIYPESNMFTTRYCGPFALAAILNVHYDVAAEMARIEARKLNDSVIGGLSLQVFTNVLRRKKIKCEWNYTIEFSAKEIRSGLWHSVWLRVCNYPWDPLCRGRKAPGLQDLFDNNTLKKEGTYMICNPLHYVLVHNEYLIHTLGYNPPGKVQYGYNPFVMAWAEIVPM